MIVFVNLSSKVFFPLLKNHLQKPTLVTAHLVPKFVSGPWTGSTGLGDETQATLTLPWSR